MPQRQRKAPKKEEKEEDEGDYEWGGKRKQPKREAGKCTEVSNDGFRYHQVGSD